MRYGKPHPFSNSSMPYSLLRYLLIYSLYLPLIFVSSSLLFPSLSFLSFLLSSTPKIKYTFAWENILDKEKQCIYIFPECLQNNKRSNKLQASFLPRAFYFCTSITCTCKLLLEMNALVHFRRVCACLKLS